MSAPSWQDHLDENGGVSASELMREFDENNDGSLGSVEVAHLAEQLTLQLQMNNQLLAHLNGLEQASLLAQREGVANHDKIRKLSQVNEAMSTELAETKRKLKISQEIVESSSSKSKDSQQEAINLKRQLDATIAELKVTQESVAVVSEERDQLGRSLRDCQSQLAAVQEQMQNLSEQSIASAEAAKIAHADTKSMLSDLRSQLGPLDTENKELRRHLEEVTSLAQSYKTKLTTEITEHAVDSKRLKEVCVIYLKIFSVTFNLSYIDIATLPQVLISFESTRAAAADLKFKLEASQNKEQERLQQYNALEMTNKNLLVRVAAAEGEVGALKNDISHLQEKDAGMLHEIDRLHSELDTMFKQRQHENDIWAEKYVALQSLHESSSQDATARFNAAIEDAKRRISDAALDRDRVEEQFHKMQAVNLSLNSTLEKHRSEHNAALEGWVTAKKDLEGQLQVLRRAVSEKNAEIDARRTEEVRNRASDLQKIKDLKQLLSDRSTSFVEVLGNTQKILKSLHQEVAAGKAKLMDMGNQALLLKNFCLQLQSKLSLPVNKLQPEIERVFEILFEKMSGLNFRHDSSQDDVASLRVTIEEEKSRAVLAEEEVSRVERRLAVVLSESKAEITKVQQDLSEAQNKLRASESDRGEVGTRLQRTQEALEAVSTQAHTLQLENQKLQASLRDISSSDASAAQNAVAVGLNEKVDQMTVLLKQAENDRADKEQIILNLKEQIKTMAGNLKSLNDTNQSLKQNLAQKEKEFILSKGSASPSPSLAEQQYLLQLKQTQEILRVGVKYNIHLYCTSNTT